LIISINLNGDLNYLKEGNNDPSKIVQGHNRNVTAIGVDDKSLWTGSFEGRVCTWDIASGRGLAVRGQTHTNQVTGFANAPGRVYSVGWDDTLRTVDEPTQTFLGESTKLDAQPIGICSASGRVYVATAKGIDIFAKDKLVHQHATKDFTPTAIAASNDILAVTDDTSSVHIFTVSNSGTLSPSTVLTKSTAKVTSVSFSPSGALLAAGNSSGKIVVYDSKTWEVATDRWSAHTARIQSIAWNAAGTHAVSGGLDTNVHVWSLAQPGKRVKAANAHKDGVNGVVWIGEGKIASVGGDAAVKTWKVDGLA
jgi:WD40 repeat protein